MRQNRKAFLLGLGMMTGVFAQLGGFGAQAAVIIPVEKAAASAYVAEDPAEPSSDGEISETESPGVYIIDENGGANVADAAIITEELEEAERILAAQRAEQNSAGQQVADYAVQFIGNPYRYGGTSLTKGADCSGFVMSVFRNFGVSLPHSSSAIASMGREVGKNLSAAKPGDVLCYSGHVGIYIGNGQMVHASTERAGIRISPATYRTIRSIRRLVG